MALTLPWDTQHDSPNQSTFAAVPYTRLTRRAYLTTPEAVRTRFLPPWRCLLVALRKVGGRSGGVRARCQPLFFLGCGRPSTRPRTAAGQRDE